MDCLVQVKEKCCRDSWREVSGLDVDTPWGDLKTIKLHTDVYIIPILTRLYD